jgi:lysophospholipase L1-like esterase
VIAALLAAVGGAGAGYAGATSYSRTLAETAPGGWTRFTNEVPFRRAELLGELRLRPDAWTLDHFQALSAPESADALALTARLPEGGNLYLFPDASLGHQAPFGVGLLLRRGSDPTATGVGVSELSGVGEHGLKCEGALPLPGPEPYAVRLTQLPGGFLAEAGGQQLRCDGPSFRGGVPALRSGLQRVLVSDLELDGEGIPPPVPRAWVAGVAAAGALAAAAVVAAEILLLGAGPLACALSVSPLLLCWWMAGRDGNALVEALRLGGVDGRWIPLLAGLAPALAAAALHQAIRLSMPDDTGDTGTDTGTDGAAAPPAPLPRAPRAWLGPAAAWLVTPLAAGLLGGLHPAAAAGLALVTAPLLALGAAALMRPLSTLPGPALARASAGVGLVAAAGAGLAWVAGGQDGAAAALVAASGAALGLVCWANVNPARVRAYNLLSLLLFAASLVGLEAGLRHTGLAHTWAPLAAGMVEDEDLGWVPDAWTQFEAIERGEHTDYPEEGYPVAYEARGDALRIVCFGGSSTGGARQNDDLDEFYPARLEEDLAPGVEVVNQGVGSWTTLHIAEYARRSLADLDPDIVTVYVGHNDQFTDLPIPQKDLYARWQSGATSRQVSSVARRSLLYNGLSFAVGNLRTHQSVAVPVSHANENLEALATLTGERGAKLLLMSEGLHPDPGALAPYWEMMEEVAAAHDHVGWLDTAWLLHKQGNTMFLDNSHLTDSGHRFLARAIADDLEARGWLERAR